MVEVILLAMVDLVVVVLHIHPMEVQLYLMELALLDKEIQVVVFQVVLLKRVEAVVVLEALDKMLALDQVIKLATVELEPILIQNGILQHLLVSQVILQVAVAVVMDQVMAFQQVVLVVVELVVKTNPLQDLDLQTLVVVEEAVGIIVLLPTDLVDLVWL